MDVVLVDVTRLLGRLVFKRRRPTGVDRVDLEYVRHFAGRAAAVVRFARRSVELSRSDSQAVFELLLSPRPRLNWRLGLLLVRSFLMPTRQATGEPRFLFNTGHSGLDQPGYARGLQRHGVRPLFFVHDLIPLTHPEYCRAGEARKHAVRMDTVLSQGQGVITNSAATMRDLAEYARRNQKPLPPAVVALLAPPALPEPLPEAPLAVPYFVMLGTIEARKNHIMVLQVWRSLVEALGAAAPRLVIIGQRGWECQSAVAMLDRCPSLAGFVLELSKCSDLELATYLRHSRALLFPSFAEGYGLPLAEALALGVPVIASDLPAFREIAVDIPDYIDPLDGPRWLEKIRAFSTADSACRAAQLQRLGTFRAPGWAEHFAVVEGFLDSLRTGNPGSVSYA